VPGLSRPLLSAILIVAIAVAYLACERGRDAEAQPPEPLVATMEADPAAAGAPSAEAPAGPPAASAPAGDSLAARVDRLGRSDDPVDVFAAYKLVTACLWARQHELWIAHHILPADRTGLPTAHAACGDIASDQIQSRLRWLEHAAHAGVHHAAAVLIREGPDGLGLSHGADIDAPENAEWKREVDAATEAGVRSCDPESIETRINDYETGSGVPRDRAMALTYWVEYMECRKRLDRAATPAAPRTILGNADSITERMGDTLGADQIAAAVQVGQRMAHEARVLPGDS
jgi:hypothetical protein